MRATSALAHGPGRTVLSGVGCLPHRVYRPRLDYPHCRDSLLADLRRFTCLPERPPLPAVVVSLLSRCGEECQTCVFLSPRMLKPPCDGHAESSLAVPSSDSAIPVMFCIEYRTHLPGLCKKSQSSAYRSVVSDGATKERRVTPSSACRIA